MRCCVCRAEYRQAWDFYRDQLATDFNVGMASGGENQIADVARDLQHGQEQRWRGWNGGRSGVGKGRLARGSHKDSKCSGVSIAYVLVVESSSDCGNWRDSFCE